MSGYLGVDLGHRTIKLVTVDRDGRVLRSAGPEAYAADPVGALGRSAEGFREAARALATDAALLARIHGRKPVFPAKRPAVSEDAAASPPRGRAPDTRALVDAARVYRHA